MVKDRNGKEVLLTNLVRIAHKAHNQRREQDPSLQFIKDAALVDIEYSARLKAKEENLWKQDIKLMAQYFPAHSVWKVLD